MKYYLLDEPYLPIGSGVERTPGLHLTDVIKSLEEAMNVQYKGDWDSTLTMDMGFLWERTLERVLAEELGERLGEVEKDGIIGSPDGIGIDRGLIAADGTVIAEPTYQPILEEYKFTWKSSAKNMPWDIWRWMVQVKSYLYMVDLNIAVMRILHVMGDYKGSGPVYRVCRLEFTPDEIERNWAMIYKESLKLRR